VKKQVLDTHTFLWFINESADLSSKALKMIEDPEASTFVSIASFWEMAIKFKLGKLELRMPVSKLFENLSGNGFRLLPISFQDTLVISTSPTHHADPFDRMIIAQAITNQSTIITRDKAFCQYEVKVEW